MDRRRFLSIGTAMSAASLVSTGVASEDMAAAPVDSLSGSVEFDSSDSGWRLSYSESKDELLNRQHVVDFTFPPGDIRRYQLA